MNGTAQMGCYNNCNSTLHGLFWGLSLALTGLLFLMDHLNLLFGYTAWEFWPLLLVVAGVFQIFSHAGRSARIFGLALMGVGGLLLAQTFSPFSVPWGLIWPGALVAVGVVILVSALFYRGRKEGSNERCRPKVTVSSGDTIEMRSVLGAAEERNESRQFSGGSLSSFLGCCGVDLSHAEIEGDAAQLEARTFLGNVEVQVPRHWQVVVNGDQFLANMENRTQTHAQAMDASVEPTKTLHVNAQAMLGNIEIYN